MKHASRPAKSACLLDYVAEILGTKTAYKLAPSRETEIQTRPFGILGITHRHPRSRIGDLHTLSIGGTARTLTPVSDRLQVISFTEQFR